MLESGCGGRTRHRLAAVDLAGYVAELNETASIYHRIDFGDGVVLDGSVDPSRFLDAYRLPESLSGKTVLDVGTATGYFALECSRRDGTVTAIDVFSGEQIASLAKLSGRPLTYKKVDIYDLPAGLGVFDLVICGSLLMHLPDPLRAVRALRTVCADRLLLSCARTEDESGQPTLLLAGVHAAEADYWHYWSVSGAALEKLCELSGFKVLRRENFDLWYTLPGEEPRPAPHVLVDCVVDPG